MNSQQAKAEGHRHDRRLLVWTGMLCIWVYVALVGGTWAVVTSFWVRLFSQLILVLLIGTWLAVRAMRGQSLPATRLDRPLVACFVLAGLATMLSSNFRLSLESTVLWAGYVLLYYLLVSTSHRGAEQVLTALVAGGGVIALATLGELLLWYQGLAAGANIGVGPSMAPVGQLLASPWPRPHLVVGNPNLLAGYLAPLLPLGLAMAASTRHRGKRVAAALWVVTVGTALAATASRGGILAAVAGVATFAILSTALKHHDWVSRHVIGWRRQSVLIFATLLVVALALWRFLPAAGGQHGTEGVRVELWGYALSMIGLRPLLGFGPDTYGLTLLQLRPPTASFWDYLPHPHNLYLGIASELGLLSLASALWLAHAVVGCWWRVSRLAHPTRRPLMAGLMAGLIAMAAHGLVEDFRVFPLAVVQGIAFVALIVASTVSGSSAKSPPWLRARVVLPPVVALCALSLYILMANWEFQTGVALANRGKWQQAQAHLDAAAARDRAMTYYVLQSGMAHGWQAWTDPERRSIELSAAIASYAAGIAAEPRYALNHANYSALLWQNGNYEEAVEHAAEAVALQPLDATYHFNLGQYYRALGRREVAVREYAAAIRLHPATLDSQAWRRAMLSADELDDVLREAIATQSPPTSEERTRRGWIALAADELQQAEGEFRAGLALQPTSPQALEGLGITLHRIGRPVEALEALEEAVALRPADEWLRATYAMVLLEEGKRGEAERQARHSLHWTPTTQAHLTLARLARLAGKVEAAVAHYDAALERPASYVGYGLTAWRRMGVAADRVPQLAWLEPTWQSTAVYREVAEYLVQAHREQLALTIYERWEAYDPWAKEEVEVARSRLRLGAGPRGEP